MMELLSLLGSLDVMVSDGWGFELFLFKASNLFGFKCLLFLFIWNDLSLFKFYNVDNDFFFVFPIELNGKVVLLYLLDLH